MTTEPTTHNETAPGAAPLPSRIAAYVGAAALHCPAELRDAWAEAERGSAAEAEAARRIVEWTDLRVEVIDFGARDGKGRSIGAEIATWRAAGTYYSKVQALRAGHDYQAAQPAREFGSDLEREVALRDYVKGARKRAEARQALGRSRRAR